jgi:two-component system, NtrC family, sensor kinase
MMFELIIAIIIVRYLRKSLQTPVKFPKWDKVLNYIMYAAIVLLVANTGLSSIRPVTLWLSHLLLLYLIYILYSQEEFGKERPVLLAIAPFIILSLFSDIAKLTNISQYSSWKSLINTAQGFSIVWMIAMFIITNKQRKDLEKEKNKTKAEEEQKSRMVSLKEQLEVQVEERTAELTKQKEELLQTLEELRSTQTQLIQSEKMASLGELTAGIAHEIQNPLNFVNNFSELNKELLGELKEEIDRGNMAEVKIIAGNVIANEEKINTHGRRADAIVKGMLQHSRLSTGQKELTDINALADEYLRLAFHGLRAKEKSFNATMKTDFDQNIPKINIVPQDIGRVILNLITNAFYVVNEKKAIAGQEYDPIVTVITRRRRDKILIMVKDNGDGVPEKVIDKIFQPFFTTKPAGQGTGLGLSLSYDIVKAHGGELKVETQEGVGSEFVIELPYV